MLNFGHKQLSHLLNTECGVLALGASIYGFTLDVFAVKRSTRYTYVSTCTILAMENQLLYRFAQVLGCIYEQTTQLLRDQGTPY